MLLVRNLAMKRRRNSVIVKVDAVNPPETSLFICDLLRRHIPEDWNLVQHCYNSLKPRTLTN